MSLFHVYVQPLDDNGVLSGAWTEVSDDVGRESMDRLRQMIDDADFDVGQLRFDEWGLKLLNYSGRYGSANAIKSIFRYRRAGSLVKVTWQAQPFQTFYGLESYEEPVTSNDEIEIFTGLLNDDATSSNIRDQVVDFKVLGRESIFANCGIPYSSLVPGDTASQMILTILDQSEITDLLTVSALNINPTIDPVIGFIEHWQGKAAQEVLAELLRACVSVLRIVDSAIIVSNRAPNGVSVAGTFYGQASNEGIENVVNIEDYRRGLNRCFNYVTWKNTSLVAIEPSSRTEFGTKTLPEPLDLECITDDDVRQTILDAYRDEFGTPKIECSVTIPITSASLALAILDQINIDYPTILYAAEDNPMPIYGIAIYGVAVYPIGVWNLTIELTTTWKILGREIDTKDQMIVFKLREV